MFIAGSVNNGFSTLCFGLITYSVLTCHTGTPGGSNLVWGTAGTPMLYYGDNFMYSIIGKEVDARYYTTGLTEADFNARFSQRKVLCVLNCQTCSAFLTCSLCTAGFYLAGGVCNRCNSCCIVCSGPGHSSCISCAPSCYLLGANCISTG